ncbi:MAG: phenylacetate-CoA oxygenase subunit PaaJ [Paracoccaceae bacterium]|nr:phenylacetate-CoA oxygenase subunit PaaJ [Paracoccaceae bacterium]
MDAPAHPDLATVWSWLAEVPDPEIPVISVTDLGIVRDVAWDGDTLVVTVTPTYSGCPATSLINIELERVLRDHGVTRMRIDRRLSPAWTTDWLSDAARAKLRSFGIAPPVDGTAADGRLAGRIARLSGASNLTVACPRCGSALTEKISQFGSTPCKASYRCKDCLEPFDYFKCI